MKILIDNKTNHFIRTWIDCTHFFLISFFILFSFQLTFKCSGSSQPPPSSLDSHVDPHTGVQLQEVTATISKDLVYEYFGKSPFKCECHAWSPRGKAKSQAATIEVACKFSESIFNRFLSKKNVSECTAHIALTRDRDANENHTCCFGVNILFYVRAVLSLNCILLSVLPFVPVSQQQQQRQQEQNGNTN